MIDPVEHNFNLYVGQTLAYPFAVWNDAEQTQAYDFTDHAVYSEARLNHDSSKSINLNATIDGNIIYLNFTPGQTPGFVIPSNNKSQKYVYDIEVTLPDGSKWTIVRGIIEAFPEVTRL